MSKKKLKLNELQHAILAARTGISKKSTWTQGTLAKNADGDWRLPYSPDACAWCAMGAVTAFVPSKLQSRVMNQLDAAVDYLYPDKPDMSFININDDNGHKAILKVFDTAYAMAGGLMARVPSVIMSQAKVDAKVDVGQIKNNLADIAKRRKEEMAEHKKQIDALDKEEVRERKLLVAAETKLAKAKQ